MFSRIVLVFSSFFLGSSIVTRISTRLPGLINPEIPITLSPFTAIARLPGFNIAATPPVSILVGARLCSVIGSLAWGGDNDPVVKIFSLEMPSRHAFLQVPSRFYHFGLQFSTPGKVAAATIRELLRLDPHNLRDGALLLFDPLVESKASAGRNTKTEQWGMKVVYHFILPPVLKVESGFRSR